MSKPLGQRAAAFLMAGLLAVTSGCATLAGSWDYGLPKDQASQEDRLWHIVFPLSVAAADSCVFKREDTYGFFLKEDMSGHNGDPPVLPYVLVRFVHAQLPGGKAVVTDTSDDFLKPLTATC